MEEDYSWWPGGMITVRIDGEKSQEEMEVLKEGNSRPLKMGDNVKEENLA